jgi:hypothetical protein
MFAYTTGVKNEANAAAVGTAMANQIRDDVAAHAAWELVEEYTPGGGAVTWYVFRCLASESGLPSDYFVIMGRTIATGELRFAITEDYTVGTHTAQHFAHNPSTLTYDSSGRNPATYVLGTAVLSASANTPDYLAWIPSGTSTKWWVIVTEDGFTVAFNGTSNGFVHIGVYEPLTVLPIDMPIQIIGTSDVYGSITRNPAVANATLASAYNRALHFEGGGDTTREGYLLGIPGDPRYNDALQGNERAFAEIGMNMYQNADSPSVMGFVLGKQKRMLATDKNMPTGFAFGDAFAINGTLWVPYRETNDGRLWDTGVAV